MDAFPVFRIPDPENPEKPDYTNVFLLKSMYYFKVSWAKRSYFFTQSSGTTNIDDYRCSLTNLGIQFEIQKGEILTLN